MEQTEVAEQANGATHPGRDALRSAALGREAKFKKKTVTYAGQKYDVQDLSVGDRETVINECRLPDGKGLDALKLFRLATVYCARVPATGERVFELGDADELAKQPASGSIVDVIGPAALEIIGVSVDGKTEDQPGKN